MTTLEHTTRKHSFCALVAAGLLLAVTLSGCASNGDDPRGTPRVVGAECHAIPGEKCQLKDGILYLRDWSTTRDESTVGDEGIGLLVDGLTVPLVIQNLHARAGRAGVEIGATCPQCSVTIEDAQIEAGTYGILVGERGPAQAGLVLHRVNITGLTVGTSVSTDSGMSIGTDSLGIVIDELRGGLVLDWVNVTSPAPSFGRAVWNRGVPTALQASNVSILKVGRAIIGHWTSLNLRNVYVECVYDAIWVLESPSVDAQGLRINNCMQDVAGCKEETCLVAAISITGKDFEATGDHVVLKDLTLTNYSWGVNLVGYRRVELENFRLTGGKMGMSVGGVAESELIMRNGNVSENQQVGVVASADRLMIERVSFDHNGFGQDNESSHFGLRLSIEHAFVGEYFAPLTIRNSSFTRNTLWGLDALSAPAGGRGRGGDLIDASYNWWGSPAGPSLWTTEPLGPVGPLPGLGDPIKGNVKTAPHLTAPP